MNTRIVNFHRFFLLVALMALATGAQGNHEWKQELNVQPGQKIQLIMDEGGWVVAKSWDRSIVSIQCESLNDISIYDIDLKETSYGLHFNADLNTRRPQSTGFKVILMVPKEFDIEIETGAGGISIDDVVGQFSGKTGGGPISLENVVGRVDLKTRGGFIKILDSDLDGKVLSSGGGGIVRNVVGDVQAESEGGIVRYENVRNRSGEFRGPAGMTTEKASARSLLYSTGGGRIDIKEAPEGACVKTGGGDIIVRQASRFVHAATGGGSIHIEMDNGTVQANTGSGDIWVSVLDGFGEDTDAVDLSTQHGNITIVVPADASIEFDLDLAYTRSSKRNFEIKSNFDLNLENSEKWKKEFGSNQWKHITGSASLNGGKHRILIHVINGNISIKTQ